MYVLYIYASLVYVCMFVCLYVAENGNGAVRSDCFEYSGVDERCKGTRRRLAKRELKQASKRRSVPYQKNKLNLRMYIYMLMYTYMYMCVPVKDIRIDCWRGEEGWG